MRFIKKIFKNSRSNEDGIFFAKMEQILGFKPTNILFYQRHLLIDHQIELIIKEIYEL
jgi:hypothetical protein